MNDDIEQRLRQVTPLGAPPEPRVARLAAVAGPLHAPAPLPSRRWFRPVLFVTASLVAGAGAQLLGERPARSSPGDRTRTAAGAETVRRDRGATVQFTMLPGNMPSGSSN